MINIKTSFGRTIKKILHILNPLAGKGTAKRVRKHIKETDETYMSVSPVETSEFIRQSCEAEPDTCFTVYGGDGTVHRAVNAVMESGCADEAMLKIVPIGSGNDFVRSFDDMPSEFVADIMKFNDKYAANIVNMGFDCGVVKRADKLKKLPLINGPMAYILGVVGELLHIKPMNAKITFTYEDGTTEVMEEKFLLIAIGNGRWYGGGFKAVPGAKLDSGVLDVTVIKNISTLRFLKLVGPFKKGKHIKDPDNCVVKKGTEKFLMYKKCIGVKVEGCDLVSADGELYETDVADVSVLPKAISIIQHKL
jgi:diacylglycerol kinase family enzyme